MLKYLLIGAGFAFAAAAQPGPLQAFLLSRVAAVGWRRTLPAALAPLISDGPIAALVLLVLQRVPAGFEKVLQVGGGCVLLAFAASTFVTWRKARAGEQSAQTSVPGTLLQAVGVNAVNPGPWLGWSLILGPLAVEAWRSSPVSAGILILAFYVTMVMSLLAFIVLVGATSMLGPRGRGALLLLAAVVLAVLGILQLINLG